MQLLLILNYIEWIKILGLSLELMTVSNFHNEVIVQISIKSADVVGLQARQDALFVDFFSTKSNQKLKTYVFLPWQKMFLKNNTEESFESLLLKLVTVNEYAVIYEYLSAENNFSEKEQNLANSIDNQVNILLCFKNNSKILRSNSDFTSNKGIQIISEKEYKCYKTIDVAVSGSKFRENPDLLIEDDSRKMILLNYIPDKGSVVSMWLAPAESAFESCILQNESELISIINKHLQNCISKHEQIDRLEAFEEAWAEVRIVIDKCGDDSKANMRELVKRLILNEYKVFDEDSENLFADYQPKNTLDLVSDFRPSIIKEINELPEPKSKNLVKLFNLFDEFSEKARSNPGEWQDGNMILGAKAKEYNPSDEELILSEVGKRLVLVLDNINEDMLKEKWYKIKSKCKEIKFKSFSFTHCDVMGSGRFFYVEEIIEVEYKLK